MIDKDGKLVPSVFKEMRLDEISAVDVPAQPDATVSIMKRAYDKDGHEDDEEEEKEQYKAEDGKPEPAEASKSISGDSADPVGNVQQDQDMTEKNDQTADAVVKQLEEVTKRAERAEAIAELNDAQKGIFKGLDGEAADAFLAMGPEQRDAEVAKAAEANAVVYVSKSTGREFRKSDDPALVEMAKELDEEKMERMKEKEKAKKAELEKRASELAHLPGDLEARVAPLKGIDSLPEAEQSVALEALKASDAAVSKAFERAGSSAAPVAESPLDTIAKRLRSEDPSLSPEQAMAKALQTPEGELAYAKSLGLAN